MIKQPLFSLVQHSLHIIVSWLVFKRFRKILPDAVRAYAMRELGLGMLHDICFERIPIPHIIPDFLA